VAGRQALYRYCAEQGIEHRRCGKLIVATDESQGETLRALRDQAAANGVRDLEWLEAGEVRRMEPAVRCFAALWSPSSGIVDSHGLVQALLRDAERRGATVAFRSRVEGGSAGGGGLVLDVGGAERLRLSCRAVVNSAGLFAQEVARRIEGMPAGLVPARHFAKGSYFALAGPPPFSRLIYPVPDAAGLGIHATLDLAGQVRFGPDVEWVEEPDYDVDPARAGAFYEAVRRYWPELGDAALRPAYAGVRPKIQGPGDPPGDFLVQGPEDHGVPGLVHLYGIESPGLTAALALADHVAALLGA
jgi:L-2-hydroxyglutarate oxidase LhgO